MAEIAPTSSSSATGAAKPAVGSRDRRTLWMWLTISGCAILLAVAVVITTIVGLGYRKDSEDDDARGDVLDFGQSTATLMFSWNSKNIDENIAATRKRLTGEAAKQYEEILATGEVAKQVKEQQNVTELAIQSGGVVSASREQAKVLLFMNQSATSKDKPNVAVTASRVQFTLLKKSGSWKVSNIELLTDDSLRGEVKPGTSQPSTAPSGTGASQTTPAPPTS